MSKHIPMRMCVICRKMTPKNELLRIVENQENLMVDVKQNVQKRGIYICKSRECIEKAVKRKAFSKILKKNISQNIYEEIAEYVLR